MTDTEVPAGAPERRHGKLRRFLSWMRDHESDRARAFYSKMGVWSSRMYAVILPMAVLLVAWSEPVPGVQFFVGMIWALVTRQYLWYQARAILANQVIQEEYANRDQINSFMPVVSIIALIILWVVIQILFYAGIATKTIDYGYLGWYMMLVALWDSVYDLRINNRIMFILARVPSRVEYQPGTRPHD